MRTNRNIKGGLSVSERAQDLMNDLEVCDVLRISLSTLRRSLDNKDSDVQKIKRVNVGGQRRWVRNSVMDLISGK
jgi:hypothetical protein